MRNIVDMNYEELTELNNEILTQEELEELDGNELVVWSECLGRSGHFTDCYWYDVQIKHPQVGNGGLNSINVYCKIEK